MTSEADFQAALDANPDDWQTRLVFADWLDERGDARGPGYRALGALRKWAHEMPLVTIRGDSTEQRWFFWCHGSGAVAEGGPASEACPHAGLPRTWFNEVDDTNALNPPTWRGYAQTRREADDAAARAFANLPEARRAELLATEKA